MLTDPEDLSQGKSRCKVMSMWPISTGFGSVCLVAEVPESYEWRHKVCEQQSHARATEGS